MHGGHPIVKSNTLQSEIDYGDIPENMDEAAMRKYLMQESNLVMPNKPKRDSFEEVYNTERQKLNGDHTQPSNRFVMLSPDTIHDSTTNVLQDRNSSTSTMSNQTSNTDPNMDRMSTVTYVSNVSGQPINKAHSFAKQSIHPNMYHAHYNQSNKMPVLPQSHATSQTVSNHLMTQNGQSKPKLQPAQSSEHATFVPPAPPESWSSGLTKQIAPQKMHVASQSGQQGGVIQSKNPEGKMVVKQLPYHKKTHMMVNLYVEISAEHVEHIIVHFLKTYTVRQFLDLLKNETNNGAFMHNELEMYCADDDGDLDDDFPKPDFDQVVKDIGLIHFYIKIRASDVERNNMRRSTIRHIQGLQSTATVDSMYSLSEEESGDESDDEVNTGCQCLVM